MSDDRALLLHPLLHREFLWFVRLRWVAGALIVLADAVQWWFGSRLAHVGLISAVGVGVLAFNALLTIADRRLLHADTSRARLITLAWTQFAVDLAALTTLTMITGGLESPLIGVYVFHMILASILLPGARAHGVALIAGVFLIVGLAAADFWPDTFTQRLFLIGWLLTLFVTVHLCNRITGGFFRIELERIEQDRRVREMQERIATNERAMHQQEKLVAIGQLAAGVAHEVSNPLAGMDGLLQLMERSPEKPRPDAVVRLREQVQRIQRTVRQLAELSHPELGMPEPTDINALIEETLKVLAYDHRLRDVEVARDFDPDVPPVNAVPRAFQQALMNLVLNALDAMAECAQPRLVLRTIRDGGCALIEVIDNGHGISSEHQENIFSPFFTTKPVGKGTGLGLSISGDLIRDQGGALTFESEAGQGATFRIRLPADTGLAAQSGGSTHPAPQAEPDHREAPASNGAGGGAP